MITHPGPNRNGDKPFCGQLHPDDFSQPHLRLPGYVDLQKPGLTIERQAFVLQFQL